MRLYQYFVRLTNVIASPTPNVTGLGWSIAIFMILSFIDFIGLVEQS
jgi:hypothetical protein